MEDTYHRANRTVLMSRKTRRQLEEWIENRDHDSLRRFAIGLVVGCTPAASIRTAVEYEEKYGHTP